MHLLTCSVMFTEQLEQLHVIVKGSTFLNVVFEVVQLWQWFSASSSCNCLIQLFRTLSSLLLHNCSFDSVMSCNYLINQISDVQPQGCNPPAENHRSISCWRWAVAPGREEPIDYLWGDCDPLLSELTHLKFEGSVSLNLDEQLLQSTWFDSPQYLSTCINIHTEAGEMA